MFRVLEKPLCRVEVSSQRTVPGRQGSLRRVEGDGLLLHNPGLEQPLIWFPLCRCHLQQLHISCQLRGTLWFHCALIDKLLWGGGSIVQSLQAMHILLTIHKYYR